MSQPGGAFGGAFGRGMLGGLAGGLLGAGLFGLLTGHGLFGGMGGFMSIIGLLLQIALIVFLARMAFSLVDSAAMRRRASVLRGPGLTSPFTGARRFGGGAGLGAGPMGFGQQRPVATPIRVAPEDFDAFERLLGRRRPPIAARTLARCAPWPRRKWPAISTRSWRPTAAGASSTACRT